MLGISSEFFSHLNAQGVRYCHWKSNEHLDRALAGKTDLDILVHPDDAQIFATALKSFDFKEVLSPQAKRFPGMADYLGFDRATGGLIHLHRHFKLVLGQRYIKNHHLPIEELMLSDLHIKDGVQVPSVEMELILLIIRAHLKVDVVGFLKHAIKDFTSERYTAFPAEIESEFSQLIAKHQPQRLRDMLDATGLPIPAATFEVFIKKFETAKLTSRDLALTQLLLLRCLKGYRRDSGIRVYWQYAKFYVAELPGIRKLRVYQKKVMPHSGKVFAIVGADGSGKSTLSAELRKWLGWKLTVKSYYYGIPKNSIQRLDYYLERACERACFLNLKKWINGRYWLYVAKHRLAVSRRASGDAATGKVVITDRFPLAAFHTMPEPMDGPRLATSSYYKKNGMAGKEAPLYQKIIPPDFIFALQVDIDELRKRKVDLDLATHKIKADAVNALAQSEVIHLIDGNSPYEKVLLEIKSKIWKVL